VSCGDIHPHTHAHIHTRTHTYNTHTHTHTPPILCTATGKCRDLMPCATHDSFMCVRVCACVCVCVCVTHSVVLGEGCAALESLREVRVGDPPPVKEDTHTHTPTHTCIHAHEHTDIESRCHQQHATTDSPQSQHGPICTRSTWTHCMVSYRIISYCIVPAVCHQVSVPAAHSLCATCRVETASRNKSPPPHLSEWLQGLLGVRIVNIT
jgi:hypothetical protein